MGVNTRPGRLKVVWTISLVVFVAGFSYFRLLPNLGQSQRSIDPDGLTGDYDPNANTANFHGVEATIPDKIGDNIASSVLGLSNEPKHIEVDLTTQRLYAFEGDKKVYEFRISSGKWYPTPTGTFRIWSKFRYTGMSGGNPLLNTYYNLPNVPFVMFFANDKVAASRGFALHGAYWHNNFGHPMSHGCVNMRTVDAGVIYQWTSPGEGSLTSLRTTLQDPGTEIIIYGVPPRE